MGVTKTYKFVCFVATYVTKPLYTFISLVAMGVTKPYTMICFGVMDVTKPYKVIRFGAMDVTNRINLKPLLSWMSPKPYEFIGPWMLPHRRTFMRFGAMAVTKPYEN